MNEMMNSKRSELLLVVFLVLVLVGLGIFSAVSDSDDEVVADGDWETYTNEEYGFSIDHPEDWNVTVSPEERVEPIITIAKEDEAENGAVPPYDHFVNATYVSILPQGLGTEGLLGQTEETEVDFTVGLDMGTDFELEDGTVFATFANLQNGSENWGDAGYIVGRAYIEDLETRCEREGEEIEDVACDIPMEEGAEVVWYGEISDEERETVEAMLESFQFLEGETASSAAE